mgnify:CR=1 FL=1
MVWTIHEKHFAGWRLEKWWFHPWKTLLWNVIRTFFLLYWSKTGLAHWAGFEAKDEAWLWLDHMKILQKWRCCLRLAWRDINSDSVLLSISHITWTSSYPQVCMSSLSFKSPAPDSNKSDKGHFNVYKSARNLTTYYCSFIYQNKNSCRKLCGWWRFV